MAKASTKPAVGTLAKIVRAKLKLDREDFAIALRCGLASVYRWEKKDPPAFYGELLGWMSARLNDRREPIDGERWGRQLLQISRAIDDPTYVPRAHSKVSKARPDLGKRRMLDEWELRHPGTPDLIWWFFNLTYAPAAPFASLSTAEKAARAARRVARDATRDAILKRASE